MSESVYKNRDCLSLSKSRPLGSLVNAVFVYHSLDPGSKGGANGMGSLKIASDRQRRELMWKITDLKVGVRPPFPQFPIPLAICKYS